MFADRQRLKAALSAAVLFLSTQTASTRGQAVGPLEAQALSLCAASPEGSPFLIVGPRTQWQRLIRSEDEVSGRTKELIGKVNAASRVLIAATDAWVVLHDSISMRLVRANCRANTVASHPTPSASRVSVSDFGDVAFQLESGSISIDPGFSWATSGDIPPQQRRVVGLDSATAGQVRALWWQGTNLWMVGTESIFLANEKTAESPGRISLGRHSSLVSTAFAFNGLTYLVGADGCIDILLGDSNPSSVVKLRRAACMPAEMVRDAYFALDQHLISVFTPDAARRHVGPRPLALSARVTGGVRQIAQAVEAMANAEWLPRLPMRFGDGFSVPPDPRHEGHETTTLVGAFPPGTWDSHEQVRRAETAFASRGWSQLEEENGWKTGTGVATRWPLGVDSVSPAGRSLSDLAKELYNKGTYSDSDVEEILSSNADLGRSLEGRLFGLDWLPLGAVFDDSRSRQIGEEPIAFVAPALLQSLTAAWRGKHEKVSPVLDSALTVFRSFDRCDLANAKPEPEIRAVVANGITLTGRSPQMPGSLSKLTNLQLRAAEALSVHCAGVVPGESVLRLLILRGVQLAGTSSGTRFRPPVGFSETGGGLTFTGLKDTEWPVGVGGDVVIAVAVESALDAKSRASYERHWLDRLLTQRRIDQIFLPVSVLELAMVADTSWRANKFSLPNVVILSAERQSGQARQPGGCDTPTVVQGRKAHDESIGLGQRPPDNRVATGRLIGVVETAVNRGSAMFFVGPNKTVWKVFDRDQSRFVPFLPAGPEDDAGAVHGTLVAGLLFSQIAPPGALSDVRLTWLKDSPTEESMNALNKLSGNRDILNVSQKLPEGWNDFEQRIRTLKSLLWVAAAHNSNESADGPPLVWKLPNAIGVGVATDGTFALPQQPTLYDRDHVDLLAPGDHIPLGTASTFGCTNGFTSFAAAYVSAVAALVQESANGDLDAFQLRARLMATAKWKPEYAGQVKGGFLDAATALTSLHENVLTLAMGENQPDLRVIVTLDDASFSTGGDVFTAPNQSEVQPPRKIFWTDVLRLTRVKDELDSNGNASPLFHMVFLRDNIYTVWDNVRIPATVTLPIATCKRDADPQPLCEGISVARVKDYVAARPSRDTVRGFVQ